MIFELAQSQKRLFNANSKRDTMLYKSFLETKGWGTQGCPFILVFPYMTIPDMIQDKIIHNVLGVKNEKSHY